MKFIIVFAALFAVALARPNQHVENLRQESDVHPLGFKFDVENSDGSKHSAEGVLKHLDTEHEALVVHGVFSYVGDDGHTYSVKYVADENGFQPEGAHLPVAPEHLH